LGKLVLDTKMDCLAWAFLPNHFHLLLRTHQIPLSLFMRRLMTGYAGHFNRRHHRSGHLFQNRYKSVICEEEPYLLNQEGLIWSKPFLHGSSVLWRVRSVKNICPGSWVIMSSTRALTDHL
jgi:hypothetical protein